MHRAGTSVIASSPTPSMANDLVNASGRNIFPSSPPSANTGRNDSSMMSDREEDRPADLPAGGQHVLAGVAADRAVAELSASAGA